MLKINQNQWRQIIAGIIVLMCGSLCAEDSLENKTTSLVPLEAQYANWTFSGLVTNEKGEPYDYFFQMQRDNKHCHAIAALFDSQSKQVLLFEESDAPISESNLYRWQAGGIFLRFNPINDSWIFGLKTKDKKGFNFKVDLLNQPEKMPTAQTIRPGMELIISQGGRLNGHLKANTESNEEFVTAKSAWFRQIWLTENLKKPSPVSGVLCRFNDGSGLYSVNMPEADALRGAIAGSINSEGLSVPMSQFVQVKEEEDGFWHIHVASPKRHLILSDIMKKDAVVAGFVTEGEQQGFCMLTKNELGFSTPPVG